MGGAAPWDAVQPHEQFFVLITGANSGIGLGIGQRLIDTFLATRPLTSHLVLIPTTRSRSKSAETVAALRRYAHDAASSPSSPLRARAGPDYAHPRDTVRRVHVLSVQLDLCDLPSVYAAAEQLVGGTVEMEGEEEEEEEEEEEKAGRGEGPASPRGHRIPRLDAVIFNAGIGGWSGLSIPGIVHNFLTKGWLQATTWPTFKTSVVGLLVDPMRSAGPVREQKAQGPKLSPSPSPSSSVDEGGKLGAVFCANVFGHYVLAHELLPLLSRRGGGGDDGGDAALPAGRIIWVSSIEAVGASHSLADFQCLRTTEAYESSKRLTDVLALTATLPGVRAHSDAFFDDSASAAAARKPRRGRDDDADAADDVRPPKMYLTQPGIVATAIFPLNIVLFYLYVGLLYSSRWLGSPWHCVTAYKGSLAPVHAALEPEEALEADGGQRVKWGSATDRRGRAAVKKTEVEGWGWEGRPARDADDARLARDPAAATAAAAGFLRNAVGRKSGVADPTPESVQEFEAYGAECWREMEAMRIEWDEKVKIARQLGGGDV